MLVWEESPAVEHDGRDPRGEGQDAPNDVPGKGFHLDPIEVSPYRRDGQKSMLHGALVADVPDQLREVAASLLEDKDCLVAGEARCDLEVLWGQSGERGQGIAPEKRDNLARENREVPGVAVAGPRAHVSGLVCHFVDVGKGSWGDSCKEERSSYREELDDKPQRGMASVLGLQGSLLAEGTVREVVKIEVGHLCHR